MSENTNKKWCTSEFVLICKIFKQINFLDTNMLVIGQVSLLYKGFLTGLKQYGNV